MTWCIEVEDGTPTWEEELLEAWEYWQQRACSFEKALFEIANGQLGDQTAEAQFVWAQQHARAALTSNKTGGEDGC